MRSSSRFKQRGIFGAILPALGGLFGAGTGVSTALGVAGKLLDRSDAQNAQDEANEFNSAQAQASRDWQERMSNTSFQRRMKDLEAAGLNPMLAISQGGAPVTGGASASTTPVMSGMMASAAATRQADSAAMQAETSATQVEANVKQIDELVIKTKQEVENLKTENQQRTALLDNIRQEYQNLVKQGLNLTEVGNQLRAAVDKMNAEIKLIGNQTVTEAFRELLVKAQTADTNASALLKGNDLEAAEKLENSGAIGKQIMPIVHILKMIVGRN